MTSSDDEIEKAVSIIIATKGTREATKEVETMHSKAHKGSEQLQRDAKRSGDANDLFTRKWKNELLMIGGALGALYGLAKYSPVASSMIDLLGTSLGYLATVVLLPCIDLIVWLSLEIIKLADAFTKLPKPVQVVISALTVLALAWALLKNLPGFDLAKKIMFGGADLLKAAAGLGQMAAGTFIAAFLLGLALGLLGVWILLKTGILDKIDQIGRELEKKFPTLFNFLKVITAPLAMLGFAVIGVVKAIDRFLSGDTKGAMDALLQIPADILRVWTSVKEILGSWGVPAGLTDLTTALVSLGSAIAYFSILKGPIAAVKSLISLPGKVVTAVTDVVKKVTGTPAKATAASAALPEMKVNGEIVKATTLKGTALDPYSWSMPTGTATDSAATGAANTISSAAADTASAATKTVGIVEKVTGTIGRALKFGGGLFSGLEALPSITLAKLSGIGTVDSSAVKVGMNSYAAGGYVASDQMAQLHKGDWIRSKYGDTTRDSTGRTDKGNGGTTVNGGITINTQSKNPEEIFRYVNTRLQQTTRSRV